MKNLKTITLALFVAVSTLATAQTKKIDATKSSVTWLAKKVTGSHEGTVKLKEGSLTFKAAKLVGGTFTVDVAALEVTDLKAGQGKEKLEGHLTSDDFFGTEKYPTATLVFKTIKAKTKTTYTVTADLTVKGVTSQVTFTLTVGKNVATTKLVIDRTKFGIKYGSGSFFDNLGDKTINDNFDVNVSLAF